jgi:outer membrane protein assembly factor BamA
VTNATLLRPFASCARISLVRYSNVVPAILIFLTAAVSPSQIRKSSKELSPSAFKLIAVQVSGIQRYKADDVIRASGLRIGETVHDDDFKDAARKLGQTGAFTDVAYSFDYAPEGTKLTLKVKEAEHFAPAEFENFVWFSNQELLDRIHALVPLFDGEMPITGPLPDDVSQALQAILDERKIPAQIDYVRVAHEDGPTEAFDYSATGARVVIANVAFTGADTAELPALASAGKSLRGTEYSRSKLLQQEDRIFLPAYLQRGYLKAHFGDPDAKITQNEENEVLVDVIFPVDSGPQYSLKGVILGGYKAIPADTLRQAMHFQLDHPADAVQLGKDADSIKALYGSRGYMDASVQVTPELDNASHTVTYRLTIHEGNIFKMGELEILGVDSRTKDRLQNNWTLMSGDTYNAAYTRRFVNQALKDVLTTGEWTPDIQETVDRKDKTVDVTLRFIAH